MAKLSTDDILKLARLARLDLSDKEVQQFKGEISEILGYVEQLQTVDVGKLEPTYQVTGLKNVTRVDEPIKYSAKPKDLLRNLPSREGNYIKVKRVL